MARNVTMALARVGWAASEDLRALFYVLASLTLAGAPLALWQIVARHLYRDAAQHLPPALVLGSLALAALLSGYILHRLYRLLPRL